MRDYMLMEKKDQPISKTAMKEALHEHPLKTLFRNRYFVVIMITQTLFWGTYNLGLGLIDIFFKGLGANLIFLGFRPFFWAIAEFPMFFLVHTFLENIHPNLRS